MAQGPDRGRPAAAQAREGRVASEEEEGRPLIEADVAVRPLASDERPDAARLLARAFCDQPLDRAVVGGGHERRLRVARAGMDATLRAAQGRADLRAAHAGGALAGVLLALPPFGFPLPPPGLAVQLRTFLRQGPGVARRWREIFDVLRAHHPEDGSAYLSLLAVDPDRQGRGIGSRLLASWLADVDAAGQPAWLETSRAENLALYRRHGFEVRRELALLGVPVWLMARSARRNQSDTP